MVSFVDSPHPHTKRTVNGIAFRTFVEETCNTKQTLPMQGGCLFWKHSLKKIVYCGQDIKFATCKQVTRLVL